MLITTPDSQQRNRDKILVSQFAAMILINYLEKDEFTFLIDEARKRPNSFTGIWKGIYNSGIPDKWLDLWKKKNG